jgi:hypothetical protein
MAGAANLTPTQRTLRAKLAAHTRWGNTPDPHDRRKATAAARANSPVTLAYWINQVTAEHPGLGEAAVLAAARNRHSAEMTARALKRTPKTNS